MAIGEATPIVLTAEERSTLEGWVRSSKTERRLVERARVVLLAAAGMASRAIGRELGCARGAVSKWRVRFAADRLAGLADRPRSGKPRTYGAEAGRRILAALDRPPPAGFARWTAPPAEVPLAEAEIHVRRATAPPPPLPRDWPIVACSIGGGCLALIALAVLAALGEWTPLG